jgi:hypothetical protein
MSQIFSSEEIVEYYAQRLHRYQFIFDTLRIGILTDGTGYWKDEEYRNIVASLNCPPPEKLTEQMRANGYILEVSMLEQKCRKNIVLVEE